MIRTVMIALALACAASAAPIKGEVDVADVQREFEFMGADDGGELDLRFKLRFQFQRFWGEPLTRYSPRYELGKTLTLRGRNGVRVKFNRAFTSKVEYAIKPNPESVNHARGGVIDVPSSIFDKIELSSYKAQLRMGLTTFTFTTLVDVNNQGLLGRNREWGWDISGSPDWSDMFVGMKGNDAKQRFKEFQEAANNGNQPRVAMELREIGVDLSSFRYAIWKQIPGAFDPLYGRGLNRQARSLIDAAVRKLRANPGGSIAADLTKRRQITDRFFDQFGDRLDADLGQDWAQLKKAMEYAPQIHARIRELKAAVDSGKRTDEERDAATLLLNTGAVRARLLPRSSLQLLQSAAQRLAQASQQAQRGELYVLAWRYATHASWSRIRNNKGKPYLKDVPQTFRYLSVSGVMVMPYTVDSDSAAPGDKAIDILNEDQKQRYRAWRDRQYSKHDRERKYWNVEMAIAVYRTRDEAEEMRRRHEYTEGGMYVESPPSLTR